MHYKLNFLDATYDAVLRHPLFVLAGNPVRVLHALHGQLSKKYSITPSDMVVDSGRSVAEVRARVMLFNGNGSVEVAAESVTAKFVNPTAPEDSDVIQDVIQSSHDALAEVAGGKVAIKEEGINCRMFLELIDSPADSPAFLRSLLKGVGLFTDLDTSLKGERAPGIHFEILGDALQWSFIFDMHRSHRNRKEVFVSAAARFLQGDPFPALKQKADHFGMLLKAAFARVGLEPQQLAKKT